MSKIIHLIQLSLFLQANMYNDNRDVVDEMAKHAAAMLYIHLWNYIV